MSSLMVAARLDLTNKAVRDVLAAAEDVVASYTE
jgi:hypothetical protein